MKRIESIDSYQAMRRAFRDLTSVEADGAATRARVLAGAGRDIARRDRLRRIAVPIAAAAAIASGSVSAALAVVHHWRVPAPGMIGSSAGTDASIATCHPADGRAVRIIPFETPATPDRRSTATEGLARPRRSPTPRRARTPARTGALRRRRTRARSRRVGRIPRRVPARRLRARGRLQPRDLPGAPRTPRGRRARPPPDRRRAARQLPARRGAAPARLAGRARYEMSA